MKDVLNATVLKAVGGAFGASFVEPRVQGFVAEKWPDSAWVPALVDAGLGIVVMLPSIPGMRSLQLTAGAVFLAHALDKMITAVAAS